MFVVKNFKVTQKEGLIIVNKSDIEQYMEQKCIFFSEYKNYSNKNEIINLLQEIIDMCKFDIANAQFDFSDIQTMVGYDYNSSKEQMIYYYNFVVILGSIYYNVFDKELNKLSYVEDGVHGPISTARMFLNAYAEMLDAKTNRKPVAYGATLIFATLIEEELKGRIKVIHVQCRLDELERKINNGEIALSSDENDLLNSLRERPCNTLYNSVYSSTEGCYMLLKKYGALEGMNDEDKLINNKLTLNMFLNSQIFKNNSNTTFQEAMNILFSVNKLNLRNNLAHCNFGYMNYYHISVTTLLFGVFTMISNEYYR